MNLYTAAQIRAWDAYTIQHEPVASIDLMERAARQCVSWLQQHTNPEAHHAIFCGKGNNGGDGLAIGRLLHGRGYHVTIYVLEFGLTGNTDFQKNLHRLHASDIAPHFIQNEEAFPDLPNDTVVIDALFGTGLNRPLDGLAAALVRHLNEQRHVIISIDVPSGMLLHDSVKDHSVVQAHHTLSFQATKMAFLLAENERLVEKVAVLYIGLHPGYAAEAPYVLLQTEQVRTWYQPRSRFGHKGTYGHGLVIGGSMGKIGATVLAAKAVMRTGAGLCTVLVPQCGYIILQTAVPEAMCIIGEQSDILDALPQDISRFDAVGIGPGLGTAPATIAAMEAWLPGQTKPLVVDADALNCIALRPHLLNHLPEGSILTPHPKEFERLFGPVSNDFERIAKASEMARRYKVVIILKGHHSFIAAPTGPGFFNSTGNSGMATGGSGDVLTGMLTALLAQGYPPLRAAQLGVYLHGLAGDSAAQAQSEEALIAGDLVAHLGAAFRQLQG